MFRLISLIGAVYFKHNGTGKFLGLSGKGPASTVVTVDNISQAVNFKITDGGKNLTEITAKNLNSLKLNNPFVRILEPEGKMSLDAYTGVVRANNKLIIWPNNESIAQKMKLNLLSDMSFALEWQGFCFRYAKQDKTFITGSCKDIGKDTFNILETTKEPEKKVLKKRTSQKLGRSDDVELDQNDVLSYHSGSNLKLSSGKKSGVKIEYKDMGDVNKNRYDPELIHEYNNITDFGRTSGDREGGHRHARRRGSGKHASRHTGKNGKKEHKHKKSQEMQGDDSDSGSSESRQFGKQMARRSESSKESDSGSSESRELRKPIVRRHAGGKDSDSGSSESKQLRKQTAARRHAGGKESDSEDHGSSSGGESDSGKESDVSDRKDYFKHHEKFHHNRDKSQGHHGNENFNGSVKRKFI